MNQANACRLSEIRTEHDVDCQTEKFKYYEDYYKRTGKLAHDIIVNEQCEIVDGYISYFLARKYDLSPDIFRCVNGAPVRKIVQGRHVARQDDEKWKIISDKFYSWVYTLRKPVVPGDILQVWTKKGLAHMQVDSVHYVTGKEFCSEYRRVRIHVSSCADTPERTEVREKES